MGTGSGYGKWVRGKHPAVDARKMLLFLLAKTLDTTLFRETKQMGNGEVKIPLSSIEDPAGSSRNSQLLAWTSTEKQSKHGTSGIIMGYACMVAHGHFQEENRKTTIYVNPFGDLPVLRTSAMFPSFCCPMGRRKRSS